MLSNLRGKFIVIDGPDGSGKSTQLARLELWLAREGATCLRARDPGGTEIGDRIRQVLLGHDLTRMQPRCEALLFMASRAQLVGETIRPALDSGKTVVCDRFISATCAYQVAAGFPQAELLQLGRLAVGDTWPHLTLVLDIAPEIGFARIGRTEKLVAQQRKSANGHGRLFDDATLDAMELRPLEFHQRVRANFQALPGFYPTPVVVIDANRSADDVFAEVQIAVTHAFQ